MSSRSPILRTNLARVRERIAAAAARAARNADEVRLVAVTKSVDSSTALELARLGAHELGENRVDRLAAKVEAFAAAIPTAPPVRWHMIGHLQRNKARAAAIHAGAVHSVDTDRLLATLARLSVELERDLDAFLEVELTHLPTRSGFTPAGLRALLEGELQLGRVKLRGLMTMAAPDPTASAGDLASQSAARRTFAQLRALAESLPRERFEGARVELSMGMSDDLDAAVAEGAHWVRVGSALFEGLAASEEGAA